MRWLTGIRARLFALVLLAVVPIFALEVYDATVAHKLEIEQGQERVDTFARRMASDLENRITDAEFLLAALARLPSVRNATQPACNTLLHDLQKAKAYANFFVADRSGTPLCSGLAAPPGVNHSDRDYFKAVVVTRLPAVGRPVIGRITGVPVLPLAQPVVDESGNVDKVLITGLDFAWVAEHFVRSGVPQGGALMLLDAAGRVLYRYPENEKWAGALHPDAVVVKEIRGSGGARIEEVTGIDGQARVRALLPLSVQRDLGVFVGFSITTTSLVAEVQRHLRRDILGLLVVALLAFGGAWILGEVLIRRRLVALGAAASRIGSGALEARVGAPYASGELGDLARSFDAMAQNLQRQRADLEQTLQRLQRSNRTLRTLSETNQALIRASEERGLLERICRIAVEFGGYRMAWIGFAERDAAKSVRPVAAHGVDSAVLESLAITWADDERGRGPTGTAIRSGKPQFARNVLEDPAYAPWRGAALEKGYASSIALPLRVNGEVIGALNLYAAEPDAFDADELKLLGEMADDLSFGIGTLRVRESHARAEAGLRLQGSALDAAANGILITDSEGTIIWANPAMTTLTGYRIDELVGRNPRILKSGRHDAAFYRALHETVRSGAVWRGEIANRRKDGSVYLEEMTITPLRGPEGAVGHFIAVKQDITERKGAETATRESEERYRSLVTATAQLVWSTNARGEVAGDLPTWREYTGQSFEQIQGAGWTDALHPDDRERVAEIWARAIDKRRLYEAEYRLRRHDGVYRDFADRGVPVLESDGRIREWIGTCTDITDRKRAEGEIRALNASLERRVAERTAELAHEVEERKAAQAELDRYFNVTRDLFCIAGFDGCFKRLNPAWENTLGWSTAELLAQPFIEFVHPEDRAATAAATRQLTEGADVVSFENRYRCKDGAYRWLAWSATPVPALQLTNAVARDVTEQKRLEADLQAHTRLIARKNLELEQANAMKSRFLANMSHELRTPLNAIIGFSEILKDGIAGPLEPQQRDFVADIHNGGQHLLALINDILDLSKVEAGMMALEPEPVAMGRLLAGSLSVVKEKALKHRLHLELQVDPALGSFAADPRKVKQIVYNLLSNAVKFTPEGGSVLVTARRVPRSALGLPEGTAGVFAPPPANGAAEYCEIAVTDTGIGIAAEDLDKLFRPFVQIDSTLARKYEGTGLGLSMVKNLVQLHGGAIGVTSEPGRGSRFTVWLPLRETVPAEAQPAREAPPMEHRAAGRPLALVIEDDDPTAQLIELQLKSEGFETMRAATAEEGLVRAAKHTPQLITLDIFLPKMDGWDFLRERKADPRLADVPVVIISVADDLEHGLALGACRVLHKPLLKDELNAALAGIGFALPNEGGVARVLVIDDNPAAVELLAAQLAVAGYTVLRAYGGADGVELAREAQPDIILLDLLMPDMGGFEVVETLQRDARTASIPVIVVTSKELSAEDRAALNGYVLQVVRKAGFNREAFLAEVRRALGPAGVGPRKAG